MSDEKKEQESDIFLAQKLYPDAKALIACEYSNIEDIVDECDIVLDTNVLLVPYLTGSSSFDQLTKTYKKLTEEKRLLIPGQVAREFAKNRSNKLTELYSNLGIRRSNIVQPKSDYHPILEKIPSFKDLKDAESKLSESIKGYQNKITEIQAAIRSWSHNDPVSKLYRELFGGECVWDLEFDNKEVMEKLDYRYKNKIPPGYKDAAKNDKGIGDLLVWLSILDIGEKRKKHMIFVTGDEKADWQHRSDNRGLFPRYELVDEYRRASEEKTFHIASLSTLLELFKVDKSIVEEIRESEAHERDKEINVDESWVSVIDALKKSSSLADDSYAMLSEREQEVFRLLAGGDKASDIGKQLNLSPKTVENHRANIFKKLNFDKYFDLYQYARRIGIIDFDF